MEEETYTPLTLLKHELEDYFDCNKPLTYNYNIDNDDIKILEWIKSFVAEVELKLGKKIANNIREKINKWNIKNNYGGVKL